MSLSKAYRPVFLAAGTALILAVAGGSAWAQEAQKPDPAQIARGAKAWADNCERCHNLRDPKELVDYEWDITVNHMRTIARFPGDMARDIKAFLKASN